MRIGSEREFMYRIMHRIGENTRKRWCMVAIVHSRLTDVRGQVMDAFLGQNSKSDYDLQYSSHYFHDTCADG